MPANDRITRKGRDWTGATLLQNTYDGLGNRYGSNIVGLYGWQNFNLRDNGLNQYTGWAWFGLTQDDQADGGQGNGVLVGDSYHFFGRYNALNQPDWMWGWGDVTRFGYDPLGRCVKRAKDSGAVTYFYYDGWNLIQEGPSATSASRTYVHGGRVDEIVLSRNIATGQAAYHHYDARGHCTLLTDSGGGILEQYEYDAFGVPYFSAPRTTGRATLGIHRSGTGFCLRGVSGLAICTSTIIGTGCISLSMAASFNPIQNTSKGRLQSLPVLPQ
jgi:hypothetical protein